MEYLFPSAIAENIFRVLIEKYCGNYFENKITLIPNFDLNKAEGTFTNVCLNCEEISKLGDIQNWPFEVIDGRIDKLTMTIPWRSLFSSDTIIEITGLSLTVQPKIRNNTATSMLESVLSSMNTSIRVAEEVIQEEHGSNDEKPVEGVQILADKIDSIFRRIKVTLLNTKIRIEHVPKESERGSALEIHIEKLKYNDEGAKEANKQRTDCDISTSINLTFENVTLYTDEFHSDRRTMSRSLLMETSVLSQASDSNNSDVTKSDVSYKMCTSSNETPEDENIIHEGFNNTIVLAKIFGEQKLALKFNHNGETGIPKLEMDMSLGWMIIFSSPRQLHTIIELLKGLTEPELVDTSNIPHRDRTQPKPMTDEDYERLAEMNRATDHDLKDLANISTWSGPDLDRNEPQDIFYKFPPQMTSSQYTMDMSTSISSMCQSMTTSIYMPSGGDPSPFTKKEPLVKDDSAATVSKISLDIASLAFVLIHKDLLTWSSSSKLVTKDSVNVMRRLSDTFFERYQQKSVNHEDQREVSAAIEDCIDKNHLRLIMSQIVFEGSEKEISKEIASRCEISVRKAILQEGLYHRSRDDVLKKQNHDIIRFSTGSVDPQIKLRIKRTSKYKFKYEEKRLSYISTDFRAKSVPFLLDVDLTLIDRMSATLFGFVKTVNEPDYGSTPRTKCTFSLHSPKAVVNLRFPIADLRPNTEPPQRNIRKDYLEFNIKHLNISSKCRRETQPQPTTVSLYAYAIDAYYHAKKDRKVHVARAILHHDANIKLFGEENGPEPMLSLTLRPPVPKDPFSKFADKSKNSSSGNPMTTSIYLLKTLRKNEPTPFTAAKMIHKSTIIREDENDEQEEELLIPGDEKEMAAFTEYTIKNSAIHLAFNLPVVSLQLESKELYELLYNRINYDLLLWEPRIVDPCVDTANAAPSKLKFQPFVKHSDDSDPESLGSEDGAFYQGVPTFVEENDIDQDALHNFGLTFKIDKGLLTVFTLVRDKNKRVLPGRIGELVFDVNTLNVCNLSGLHGKKRISELAVRAKSIIMYHEASLPMHLEQQKLRLCGTALPQYLKKTIYPSDKGVLIKSNEQHNMFCVAYHSEPDVDNSELKSTFLAFGLEQATMRYRGDKGISWFTQMMEILDVTDYPVPGYKPTPIVSELHVNIVNCAIDYRPLYLPIRCFINIGNFYVSSSVIYETEGSAMRFILEDFLIFLSYVREAKPDCPVPLDDAKAPNLLRDYVCVVTCPVFELQTTKRQKITKPDSELRFELCATNNMLKIDTCWDSASALCRLIEYVAVDGDNPVEESNVQSVLSEDSEDLIGLKEPVKKDDVSLEDLAIVAQLVLEASEDVPGNKMEDVGGVASGSSSIRAGEGTRRQSVKKSQLDVFLDNIFKDEEPVISTMKEPDEPWILNKWGKYVAHPYYKQLVELRQQKRREKLNPDKATSTKSTTVESNDDGFVLLNPESNEVEDHYCAPLEEPPIYFVSKEEVNRLLHYKKSSDKEKKKPKNRRMDCMDTPTGHPPAVERYTLQEMWIRWTLYEGSDFKTCKNTSKKRVRINDDAVSYSTLKAKKVDDFIEFTPKSPESLKTKRPPPYRDLENSVTFCLNKVRFKHEVYPETDVHNSFQVFAINRIIINDNMKDSYSKTLLKRLIMPDEPVNMPHEYMFVVKAVRRTVDPEPDPEEVCMLISMMPLDIDLDQKTFLFLTNFFNKIGTDENPALAGTPARRLSECIKSEAGSSKQNTPTHQKPVMTLGPDVLSRRSSTTVFDDDEENLQDSFVKQREAERMVTENLIHLEEDFSRLEFESFNTPVPEPTEQVKQTSNRPTYFRKVIFWPEVPIRFAYHGRGLQLSGALERIFIGLAQLRNVNITLKAFDTDQQACLHGIERVLRWAFKYWAEDLRTNQINNILGGIGPISSIIDLLTGVLNLFLMPLMQWRRDGRLVYGLRRGASSFTARTTLALLDLTSALLHLIQSTAEAAFDVLCPRPSLPLQDAYSHRERHRRRRRNSDRNYTDIREGVTAAFNTFRQGFTDTANTMALASRCENTVGVLRHAPSAMVSPLAITAAGIQDVIGGLRAQIEPPPRIDLRDMRHSRDDPHVGPSSRNSLTSYTFKEEE